MILKRLNPDQLAEFLFHQLDQVGLGHNTFTEDAVHLVVRSADGILRRARNPAIGSLLEAVRAQRKNIDIDLVNKVLIQPHWRRPVIWLWKRGSMRCVILQFFSGRSR